MPEICIPTPIGPLTIVSKNGAIVALQWRRGDDNTDPAPELDRAAQQLEAYFADGAQAFDLPLRVEGSDLQRAVCDAMCEIPFGQTRTYGDIARRLGVSAQAVGQACGGNPIPVIIPCHRVLGATSLGGYSGEGGIETKVWLLRHEGAAGLLL